MIDALRDSDVAIIGLGVIGGSAALRVRERGTLVRSYSTSTVDCEEAARAGLTVASSLEDAVRDAGLVLIAVPLDRIAAVADEVMDAAPRGATILHAGSLQRMEALQFVPEHAARVIGTHPFAGSHRSGFSAARSDLFRDATVFVEQRATARQREDAELFWSLAGARRIEYVQAAAHDDAMAWMSHLPQLASTALGATLADAALAESDSTPVTAGPGARDATRLAMSALAMWRPLLERAPGATLAALDALEAHIHRLRIALDKQDWRSVGELWARAGEWRSRIEQGEGR